MTELRNDPEIELLCELVRCASVTPNDGGCQAILIRRLEAMGFACETLVFGEVTNLWARRGKTSPVLCFAGHTDVVPPGDTDAWSTDPFE
ncbi:MAG: succinyl-diaminopimelate desuccinylase, partial [Gammaproteobacteria bacterium]|nr:succinyl-diaminopimelate desuccinylase [Gammaproteobacteria bacterium]